MGNSNWTSGETTTLLKVFRNALQARGEAEPFLDYDGKVHTLGDMDRESTRLAHGLLELGVQPGQCVASILDSCIEQILLLLATAKIGAIHVGMNTANKGEFLRHQVADCKAPVVVAHPVYAERVMEVEKGLPDLRVLLVKGQPVACAESRLVQKPFASAFLERTDPPAFEPKPSDIAVIIFTGGTTGPSKGCMVSHNYLCNLSREIAQSNELTAQDVVWTPLPAFHLNQPCNMWAALMRGARFAVYPRFSVSNFWPEVERTKATVVNLLGTMVTMLADAPDNEASRRCYGQLRVVGGVPFPKVTQEVWRKRFGVKQILHAKFGQTECSPITSAPLGMEVPTGACGMRNENFDVMIVDELDNELPVGQAGEIVVRPRRPHVMFEGYWNRPDATCKQWRNGWFHTGDLGRFDEEGFMYFVDRAKDYLRRRGENISSMEMETVFRSHPALAEVAVHAVKAEHPEDEVKVTAVLAPGASITPEELCQWSIDHVPYFAVPRFIEFREDLPRNPVGRILKYKLKDDGITATTWDREKSEVVVPKR